MPYINDEHKTELMQGRSASTPGELNFLLTLVVKDYLDANGLSYQVINDIVGALEGCKIEFYRRVAVDYEQSKIKQNGDVY